MFFLLAYKFRQSFAVIARVIAEELDVRRTVGTVSGSGNVFRRSALLQKRRAHVERPTRNTRS